MFIFIFIFISSYHNVQSSISNRFSLSDRPRLPRTRHHLLINTPSIGTRPRSQLHRDLLKRTCINLSIRSLILGILFASHSTHERI